LRRPEIIGCTVDFSSRANVSSSVTGNTYGGNVVPSAKLPFELFVTHFFRFKEYSDKTTTMDHQMTLAGAAIALGNFDYYGLSPEELYERVPVTRDYEQSRGGDDGKAIGLGLKVRLTPFFPVVSCLGQYIII